MIDQPIRADQIIKNLNQDVWEKKKEIDYLTAEKYKYADFLKNFTEKHKQLSEALADKAAAQPTSQAT